MANKNRSLSTAGSTGKQSPDKDVVEPVTGVASITAGPVVNDPGVGADKDVVEPVASVAKLDQSKELTVDAQSEDVAVLVNVLDLVATECNRVLGENWDLAKNDDFAVKRDGFELKEFDKFLKLVEDQLDKDFAEWCKLLVPLGELAELLGIDDIEFDIPGEGNSTADLIRIVETATERIEQLKAANGDPDFAGDDSQSALDDARDKATVSPAFNYIRTRLDLAALGHRTGDESNGFARGALTVGGVLWRYSFDLANKVGTLEVLPDPHKVNMSEQRRSNAAYVIADTLRILDRLLRTSDEGKAQVQEFLAENHGYTSVEEREGGVAPDPASKATIDACIEWLVGVYADIDVPVMCEDEIGAAIGVLCEARQVQIEEQEAGSSLAFYQRFDVSVGKDGGAQFVLIEQPSGNKSGADTSEDGA